MLGAFAALTGLWFARSDTKASAFKGQTMWTLRKARDRGHANHGWLDTHHTFSFANYYDPRHMGFGPLRVINDDRVDGGAGFGTHPHRDMEIITFVKGGALEHKDTSGGGGIIKPGDVQHMTAGTGVRHSEFNASQREPVRFLQIWIMPETDGKKPRYQQKTFPFDERRAAMKLVASPGGAGGSIAIGQDVALYASLLSDGDGVEHDVAPGRKVWIHVASGEVDLDGEKLIEGDGAWAEDPGVVRLRGRGKDAEVLTFDMA